MFTIFKNTLRRNLWQLLGWGITFGLVTLYLMLLYKPLIEQQSQLTSLIQAYGPNFMAFFGGTIDIISAGGYMDFGFFSYIPIVAGIFALLVGSGLVLADEERGTLDLVLAHPISRTALFWGRFLAFSAVTASILLMTWLGFLAGLSSTGWEVNIFKLLLPHLDLFAVLMLFGALALLLSLALPSRTLAASLTGALLVASYFVTSLARVSDKLASLNGFSPLKYYQGGRAVDDLNWQHLLGLLGFALLFTLLAWLLFERRDVRVSGTGSWKLPAWMTMEWWLSLGKKSQKGT
jgi:ABC-2 type transport system permease protein